jgi:hypothetical protein
LWALRACEELHQGGESSNLQCRMKLQCLDELRGRCVARLKGPVLRGQRELLVLLGNPGTCGLAASQAAVRGAIGSSLDSDADSELREVTDEKYSMSNSSGLQRKGGSCVLVGA